MTKHAQAVEVPHRCHWPGCEVAVPPAMWGCREHWFRLPRGLRRRIWAAYRPGQEVDKRPSPAYIEAAAVTKATGRAPSPERMPALWFSGHPHALPLSATQGEYSPEARVWHRAGPSVH